MSSTHIKMEGVSTHNLKNISVEIPKNQLVVVTGVSGSGKSSLIIDTLFHYSKSLYIGALSSRSFDMGEGDYHVESISGTQPPIALKQSVKRLTNPRSTIGTLTGLDGLFRLLFAHGAKPVCPACFSLVDEQNFCEECGVYAEPLIAKQFSANTKEGKCINCNGLGELSSFCVDLIIPDKNKSLNWIWDNAQPGTYSIPNVRKAFEAMAADEGIDLDIPYRSLSEEQQKLVLYGSTKSYTIKIRKVTNDVQFQGIIGYQETSFKSTTSVSRQKSFNYYIRAQDCDTCHGGRLRAESLAVTLNGLSFNDFQAMTITDITKWLVNMEVQGKLLPQVSDVAKAIVNQCHNIENVGLEYLSLNRVCGSLSGGELQRIFLAQHVASDLSGVMYVLDEPTIGLHEHDTVKLLDTIRRLRDLGNSVIVIEHDETIISAADWLIEVGPGAGDKGGEVVFEGGVDEMLQSKDSATGRFMCSRENTNIYHPPIEKWLSYDQFSKNNLRVDEVKFPLNALSCVTGLSGSGKSSLIDTLYDEALRAIAARMAKQSPQSTLKGIKELNEVIYVEQKPIGRSSRSTIVTYLGISDGIRDLFAAQPMAAELGFEKSSFSSNVPGGRCETCKGQGMIEIDMSIFKSEYALCDECDGKKFQEPILAVKLFDKNIDQVLSMTVEQALIFFGLQNNKIKQALNYLNDFGLGYLVLGSSTTTLSGGEAQRLNLATELVRQKKTKTLFIFDEPTRGLHFSDITYLLKLFEQLLREGHTVIIIEHNLDVISQAHWVVDMGPEGGDKGGLIVYMGTVEDMVDNPNTHTGDYLFEHFQKYYQYTQESVEHEQ